MNRLLFLFVFCPLITFSQAWEYQEGGNAFDGFFRLAYVSQDYPEATLFVSNNGTELEISNASGTGENDRDNLQLGILLKGFDSVSEVLMSFDKERDYYRIDFWYNKEAGIINILEGTSSDYSKYLDYYDVVRFFKIKGQVHFRIKDDDNYSDISFSLVGSTAAINKTVRLPNKEIGDDSWSVVSAALLWALSGLYHPDIFDNCERYLNDKYGKYFLVFVAEIIQDDDTKEILFKNENGEIVLRIGRDVYLRNASYLSGTLKEYSDEGALLADKESIELIFSAFKGASIISSEITVGDFEGYSRPEIEKLYDIATERKLFKSEVSKSYFMSAWGIDID